MRKIHLFMLIFFVFAENVVLGQKKVKIKKIDEVNKQISFPPKDLIFLVDNEKNKKDSIALAQNKKNILTQNKKDSITLAQNKENLAALAQNKKKSITLAQNKENLIAQKKAISKALAQNKKDSTALVQKKENLLALAQNKKDSKTLAQNEENLLVQKQNISIALAQSKKDSIALIKYQNDSIILGKNKENLIELNDFKNTIKEKYKNEKSKITIYKSDTLPKYYKAPFISNSLITTKEEITKINKTEKDKINKTKGGEVKIDKIQIDSFKVKKDIIQKIVSDYKKNKKYDSLYEEKGDFYKYNLDNMIMDEYLKFLKKKNIQPKQIDQDKLSFYSTIFEINKIDLNKVLIKKANCDSLEILFDEKYYKKLDTLKYYFNSIKCLYDTTLIVNKCWIEHWLWFTKGDIKINPFPFYDPKDKLYNSNQSLAQINKQIEVLDRRIACCEIGSEEFQLLKGERTELEDTKSVLLKKIEQLSNVKKDFDKWKIDRTIKNELIYQFPLLKTSDKKQIFWIHNYDVSRELELLNESEVNLFKLRKLTIRRKFTMPRSVWEDDKVIVALHNIDAKQTINFKADRQTIPLKSRFEEELVKWESPLNEAIEGVIDIQKISNSIKNASKITDKVRESKDIAAAFSKEAKVSVFQKNWGESGTALEEIGIDRGVMEKYNTPTATKADEAKAKAKAEAEIRKNIQENYIINIKNYSKVVQLLEWLKNQTTPYLVDYELNNDETPKFYTKLFDPEKISPKKGNKITYNITSILAGDTLKVEREYIKHNLIKIYPTAGVGYIFGSRTNSTYSGNGQFDPNFDFGNIEPYVGVKWYPWQMNITNDGKTRAYINDKFGNAANIMRGNSQLNRVSVVLALGVQHKFLKNYIFGLSYDLIPGLAIQGGGNLFFRNQYKLDNNKVIDKVEVPKVNWYAGISVDLGIASSIVKFFSRPSL